ncbi:MAG: hypothetical protein V4689_21300 [Verrucomicrobiota bacterium]
MNQYNPFEFDAAAKLSPEQILQLYIPNFTYSRFLSSRRNIFLEGERGSGKSIALRYNSVPVKCHRENGGEDILLSGILCIYIPCNTPLTHRQEYELLENFPSLIISEHFLVCNIMYHIAENLSHIENLLTEDEEEGIKSELSYSLDVDLPSFSLFDSLMLVFQKEVTDAERAINKGEFEQLEGFSRSFSSGVLPLCSALRKAAKLRDSHFAFLIDDAQELNRHQIQSLNSWIAYRDNSIFSFKVASTKVERPNKMTNSGGNILEGHDYLSLDMELPYQNMNKDFGDLARQILEKRIAVIAPGVSVDEFFPEHPKLKEALDIARDEVMAEAREMYPEYDQKQLNDYTYKRYRARYFNRRKPTANLPIYSGVETIVSLSTGVVRNLLEPCFWMYDRVISEPHQDGAVHEVSPTVQDSVILGRSRKKWESIKDDLVKTIVGCSRRDAERIYNLLDKLCELFRKRLSSERSEPRAVMFTISDTTSPVMDELLRIISIARKARLIYVYRSSGKSMGAREDYYVPNRLLLPERGLDPVGQHARVSLRAVDLWNAADRVRSLPGGDLDEEENNQPELL